MFISTIFTASVLIAGVFSASFESPFSSLFGRHESFKGISSKGARSVDAPRVQICGFRLLEAVRRLCGGYFSTYRRRSDPAMPIGGGVMEEFVMPDSPTVSMDLNNKKVPGCILEDVYGNSASSDYPKPENNLKGSPQSLIIKGLTQTKGHTRFRRNIIDECCTEGCSENHMRKYCGRI